MVRLIVAAATAAAITVPAGTPAPADASATDADPCSRSAACVKRVKKRMIREHRRKVVRPYRAWLASTARCESGGQWAINTGNGFYGGLQFKLKSWQAVGGRGFPHHATQLEQEYRGVRLLRLQGAGAWPVCG